MRLLLRLVGLLLIAAGAVGSWGASTDRPTAAQTGTGIFSLSARADGLGLEFVATGFPVVPEGKVAFISPATAQAALDQFSGTAFASAPYAGDLIVNLPTTVNGLGAGSLPPFPAYPFNVATDSATPDRREEVGPYRIAAHSEPNLSNAEALIGLSTSPPQVASVTAMSKVTRSPDTGALVAEAITHTAPFRLNELVSIGDIISTSRFTYDPSNPGAGPIKESSLSVGTITIAGIEVGLTEDGLSVDGNPLIPVDPAMLTSALAGTGYTLELLPQVETETAITSSAVQLTYRREFPAPFLDTTVRLILGRSSASLATGSLPTRPTTPSTPARVATPPAGLGAPPTASAGSTGTSTGGFPAPATGSAAAPTAAPAGGDVAAATTTAGPIADFQWFYPVMAGAALVAATSSRLVQWLSYRSRLSP